MKKILVLLCLGIVVPMVSAQETNEVEQLKRQILQMQENFEKERNEDRQTIKSLSDKVDELLKENATTAATVSATRTNGAAATASVTQTNGAAATAEQVTPDQMKELSDKVDAVVEAQTKVRPNEFNPAIGLVGETIFSYTSRGSDQTGNDRTGGFDVNQRSVELNVSASVDPFATAYAVLNASADAQTGEANVGVEEAALQTTSLPWNLQLKAGRFFGEFGKLSYIHDHELPFVNRPLVLDQYIGGESRTDGAQLNWLPPLSHYFSVTAGFGEGFGGDSPVNNPGAYRALSGLNYFGRASTYFDVTPNIELETGISGLINPHTHDRGGVLVQPNGSALTEKERQVAGFDFRLSYVPLQNNQFKRIDWGTEVLYSHSRFLNDPDGSLNPGNSVPGLSGDEFERFMGSLGLYSYVTYKWHRQWSAGFLFDYVQNAENHNDETFAYSPYVTYALSHWNQLRLQYTHTDHDALSGLKSNDAIYLQWAWIIGAHSHGWQSR